jgi:pimeloyl-ACP methyl ester carboxylesterase
VKPAYFGQSARPLYGVHEPPRAATARDAAVVLCYPGVQEYNTSHWAFRRLAGMVAREGFHVLRFDWSGTGDSWGETTDGGVEPWLADLAEAAQEVRDAAGVKAISIVGMRLGAAIAAIACNRGLEVDDLILWEPVVRGSEYIEELESLDTRENLRLLHRVPTPRTELVGFPFTPALRQSIGQIDLAAEPRLRAKRVAVVSAEDRPNLRDFVNRVGGGGTEAHFVHAPEDAAATNAANRDSALLANRSLKAITTFLAALATRPEA